MKNMKRELSVDDLCKLLNKTRKTIYNWREQGMPFYKKKNGEIVFYADEVSEWLRVKIETSEQNLNNFREAGAMVIEASLMLKTFQRTLTKVKKFELLESSGVNITEEMREDYKFNKKQAEEIENLNIDLDEMQDIVTVVDFLIKQKPTNKVQKDLIIENAKKLKEIMK